MVLEWAIESDDDGSPPGGGEFDITDDAMAVADDATPYLRECPPTALVRRSAG